MSAGGKPAQVLGISGDGSTEVGQVGTSAALWRRGELGTSPVSLAPNSPYLSSSFCSAVSYDGMIQVGGAVSGGSYPFTTHPFIWRGSAASAVDLLQPWMGYGTSFGQVSDDGEKLFSGGGGYFTLNPFNLVPLPQPNKPKYLIGTTMSPSGNFFAGYYLMSNNQGPPAILQLPESENELLKIGYPYPIVYSVSDDGVVAGIAFVDGRSHAVVWNGPAPEDVHPPGHFESWIDQISRDGTLAAGAATSHSGVMHEAGLWSLTDDRFVDLHQGLPDSFSNYDSRQSEALALDGQGNAVGYAMNYQTNGPQPIFWKRVTPPAIVFQSASRFQKDAVSGHFEFLVETSQATVGADSRVQVTIADPLGGLNVSANFSVPAGVSHGKWVLDLQKLGAPRFRQTIRPVATVTLSDSAGGTSSASTNMPAILLPVVVVHGITLSPFKDPDIDTDFDNAMHAAGYVSSGSQPLNLFFFPYSADYSTLAASAWELYKYVNNTLYTSTYASSCDVVAHSKGGLVARE